MPLSRAACFGSYCNGSVTRVCPLLLREGFLVGQSSSFAVVRVSVNATLFPKTENRVRRPTGQIGGMPSFSPCDGATERNGYVPETMCLGPRRAE